MTQFMTPDEIQKSAQQLKAAFDSGAITAEQFNKGMTDVTKGVKDYTANLSASLAQLGTAAKSLGEGMVKGTTGMSQYNNAVTSGGNAAAEFAAGFGPLGLAVAALIKVVTFGISQVTDMADGLYKANQDIAKTGAAGKEGMTGIFNTMQKFGYGIKELGDMTELISSNSRSLADFGGSVEVGTNALANAAKGIKNSDVQRQLMNMGMSVNDINKGIAGYVGLQTSLGIQSTETNEELAAHAADYIMQQDRLTKLTGQSAEQLQSNQAEAQQVEAWNAKLATMKPNEAKAYQAAYDMMRSSSKTAALGFAASVTGMTGMTKESAEAFQMTGGAIGALTKQYQNNIANGMDQTRAAAEFKQGMADAAAKTQGLATSVAMVGGSAGMGGIIEHNKLASFAGGKVIASLNKVEQAQEGQKDGFDKNTDEHTKLLQQQMATRDSFQSLVEKGIGPVTSSFQSIAKVLNKILHPFGGGPQVAEQPPSASGGGGSGGSGGGGSGNLAPPMQAGAGDTTKIMDTIKNRESGGDYKAQAKGSSASGAYQFIDKTWQSLTSQTKIGTEYKSAKDAPPEVQDAIAKAHVENLLKQAKGDVTKIPLAWYTGNIQGKISDEAVAKNNGLTPEKYQEKWLKDFANNKAPSPTTAKNGRQDSGVASAPLNMPEAKKTAEVQPGSGQASLTPYQQQQLDLKKKMLAEVENLKKAQAQPTT